VSKITNIKTEDYLSDKDFSNSYYKYGNDDSVDVTMAYEYRKFLSRHRVQQNRYPSETFRKCSA
jgi:hypothetical protein